MEEIIVNNWTTEKRREILLFYEWEMWCLKKRNNMNNTKIAPVWRNGLLVCYRNERKMKDKSDVTRRKKMVISSNFWPKNIFDEIWPKVDKKYFVIWPQNIKILCYLTKKICRKSTLSPFFPLKFWDFVKKLQKCYSK